MATAPTRGALAEVLWAFLRLGLTSFGGPIAHLGYFRQDLVVRRRWVDEATYADLVALCQFLPGPASSQVGFALGVVRGGGLLGGIVAWTAFSLPSALVLGGAALGAADWAGTGVPGVLHGLKLVAVAVVAQAVWGMARSLTPDRTRGALALAAVLLVTFAGGTAGQLGAIALGAIGGLVLCRAGPPPAAAAGFAVPVSRHAGAACLALFAALFVLPTMIGGAHALLFDAFYRSGALVFGGGHVVLPLLKTAVVEPGWVSEASFLTGYGLAQAVPGPLFTFAAYLGAEAQGLWGAVIALVGLSLPGLLLVHGALPFWHALRRHQGAQAAMRGANAAVVGVLGAALYDPVWTGAVLAPSDFALALGGFLALVAWQVPPIAVVGGLAAAGAALG